MLLRILLFATLVGATVAQEEEKGVLGACATKCFTDRKAFPAFVNFVGTTPTNQFSNIDLMCSKKGDVSACVEQCDSSESQFHSEYINLVCADSQLAELQMHKNCLNDHGEGTMQICDTHCGGSVDDMKNQKQLNSSAAPMTEDFCKLKKCHIRCFVETLTKMCLNSDEDIVQFSKRWFKNTLEAMNKDIAAISSNSSPQLCDFFSDPNILFRDEVKYGAEFSIKAGTNMRSSLAFVSMIVGIILAQLYHL